MLVVDSLTVRYTGGAEGLRQASVRMARGEAVAVLGRSGSGKTTLANAIAGLLPETAQVTGAVQFEPGNRCSVIFQSPGEALHPFLTACRQIEEVLHANAAGSGAQRRDEAARLLREAGLDPQRIGNSYPHELSGGERQRVSIAQALAARPALLIADEPTASLDTVTERAIVELVRQLQGEHAMAVLWITHSPLVAAQMDRVVVLEDGVIVEVGVSVEVLRAPRHEATAALLRALPPRLGAQP